MISLSGLKVGDKVWYQPPYYPEGKWDNGIVKEIPDFALKTKEVRVVFHCNEDWDNYKDYTSQLTNISNLNLGWKYTQEEQVATKITEIEDKLKVSTYPKPIPGTMSCGKIKTGVQIEYPEEKLIVICDKHKSQVKNKMVCIKLIENYINNLR